VRDKAGSVMGPVKTKGLQFMGAGIPQSGQRMRKSLATSKLGLNGGETDEGWKGGVFRGGSSEKRIIQDGPGLV